MGRKNNQTIIRVLVLYALLFSACVKDKPSAPVAPPPANTTDTATGNVYVVCEGSLGNGNSKLSMYDTHASIAYEDVYASVNSNASLGDVFQSMVRIEDRFFLCINNSDKIIVLNRADRKQVGSINVPKPRFILPISADKAYVSTLFSNKVYIINPQSLQVTGSITMPYQNPEGMVMYNNKAYICTWDTACGNVYTIDPATDKIEKTIAIAGRAPQKAVIDKHNRLWVLSGNVPKGKPAAFTVLDANNNVVKSYSFPEKADVIKPVFNNTGDKLYYIAVNYNGGTDYNGIYRMGIEDADVPQVPFIQAQQYQYFWALGIHPVNGNVYIGDPKGFIQKGAVYTYDATGNKTGQFSVGVGPGHFYFD